MWFGVWHNRNCWKYGKPIRCGDSILLTDFVLPGKKVNNIFATEEGRNGRAKGLDKHDVGWLDANSNASFFELEGCSGLGVVVRDNNGNVELVAAEKKWGTVSTVYAELQPIALAGRLVKEKGSNTVIFGTFKTSRGIN